ncbi:hypothetical protein GOV14_00100 [Candidatus Pacearchaeota archaeon]|nr:hypothetical protein [Candidatus Pacearchaeota archaeon]
MKLKLSGIIASIISFILSLIFIIFTNIFTIEGLVSFRQSLRSNIPFLWVFYNFLVKLFLLPLSALNLIGINLINPYATISPISKSIIGYPIAIIFWIIIFYFLGILIGFIINKFKKKNTNK